MTETQAPARTRRALTGEIIACGAIAVVRQKSTDGVLRAVEAIRAGGVRAIELTLTTPGAVELITQLRRELGDDLLAGMGSVLDAEQTRRAVEAGARYIVSPVFRRSVIDEAHRLGVPAMPAGFTPTEILDAHEAGADVVKITPADVLGPAFIKGVLAPMPFLRLMPTGGVTTENVGEWLRAGAVAVGVGSALVDAKLVAAGDFATLTERARRMVAGVEQARRGGAR